MVQIAIVVYPGMTALDAIGPYEVLNCAKDRELRFVGGAVGPIVTDSGALVLGATHTFAETPAPDIVLVPGSSADTTTQMANGELIAWLRSVHAHTRFTTSVCSGALILAAAGLLEGKPATTHWLAMPALAGFGAEPRPNERVVRAGKIFTAAGVSAGIDLGLRLLAELDGEEEARAAQLMIEYDPEPPFDCGHRTKADPATLKRARRRLAWAAANPRDALSIPTILFRRFRDRLARGRRTSTADVTG